MKLLDCFQAALASLRANKLRTGLTTLGIIIGVAAVIAMVGVGKGAEKRIEEAIASSIRFSAPLPTPTLSLIHI